MSFAIIPLGTEHQGRTQRHKIPGHVRSEQSLEAQKARSVDKAGIKAQQPHQNFPCHDAKLPTVSLIGTCADLPVKASQEIV